ncbi:MAG: tetratricopeptide repeat protein [Dysgonamonadaceae bacterium]|jgi:tetratricopeptide (TPR) repeat protein|nr:tetratricopeptide repeat protein [Dysgonamonadaceae bacterium]
MATKAPNTTTEQNVGEIFSRSEQFIEKYQKQIIIGVSAVILLVVAIIGIRHAYLIPKEREAENAMFKGEDYFAQNQYKLALEGDSVSYIGFEAIIDQYGFTKSANLAKAYAGICYYKLGNLDNALKYLKDFDANDRMISPAITGLIGDCYVNQGKVEQGIDYFNKAASKADNELLSPVFLKKAGLAYESLKDYKKAIDIYAQIKDKYPNSLEGSSIDKYIDRAQSLMK